MTMTRQLGSPVQHPDRFSLNGEGVGPSSDAVIDVLDSHNEELFFRVAVARAPDIHAAVTAARRSVNSSK